LERPANSPSIASSVKIARKMIDMAKAGDQAVLFELLGRLDGRIPQPVDQNVNVEPITMIVTGVPRPGDDAKLLDASAERPMVIGRKARRKPAMLPEPSAPSGEP
jgi:hypothetical protein